MGCTRSEGDRSTRAAVRLDVDLPLDPNTRYGFILIGGGTSARDTVALADGLDLDSLWVGDHMAWPVPIHDPLLLVAQAAAWSERLLFGTAVYLLPLRHPVPVAKQVTTLEYPRENVGGAVFHVGHFTPVQAQNEICVRIDASYSNAGVSHY